PDAARAGERLLALGAAAAEVHVVPGARPETGERSAHEACADDPQSHASLRDSGVISLSGGRVRTKCNLCIGILQRMQLSGIDLTLLVVLDALLQERSVSRAAQRVGLSASAMSHALARLRDVLDDPILIRSGREMVPSPRAEA